MRPPVAQDRIRLTAEGQVRLELRHRWADGTTHLIFDPVELLERLAALTPRPRINLILYYGVLGAHAAWRSRVGAGPAIDSLPTAPAGRETRHAASGAPRSRSRARSNLSWAQLMQRSFIQPTNYIVRRGNARRCPDYTSI